MIAVRLNIEKSKFAIPGPRRTGSVLLAFPNVKGAGKLKHDVLNQPLMRDWAEPETVRSQFGATFGRNPVLKPVVFGVAVNPRGNPSWNVVRPVDAPSGNKFVGQA